MSKLRCLVSLSLAFGMAHNAIAADSEQMRSWAESYYGEYRSGTVPSFRPDSGYVPNEQTAIDIAKSIWKRIYGEEHTEGRSPYRAFLIDGYWIVLGSLLEGYDKGGVPHAILSKRTGEVVHVIHTK